MMRTNFSAIEYAKQLQRDYNRLSSQLVENISRPYPRLTRVDRFLFWVALEWPEPFAGIAGRYYMRCKLHLDHQKVTP